VLGVTGVRGLEFGMIVEKANLRLTIVVGSFLLGKVVTAMGMISYPLFYEPEREILN
jgi:hypothetical protein